MKFYVVTTAAEDLSALETEYRSSREIGIIRIGENNLFFRQRRKVYYIPYQDIRRCFRRVLLVPAKLACCSGELQVENLVVQGDAGELAQLQLPGTKAAKILIEELKQKMPNVDFTAPSSAAGK